MTAEMNRKLVSQESSQVMDFMTWFCSIDVVETKWVNGFIRADRPSVQVGLKSKLQFMLKKERKMLYYQSGKMLPDQGNEPSFYIICMIRIKEKHE